MISGECATPCLTCNGDCFVGDNQLVLICQTCFQGYDFPLCTECANGYAKDDLEKCSEC